MPDLTFYFFPTNTNVPSIKRQKKGGGYLMSEQQEHLAFDLS